MNSLFLVCDENILKEDLNKNFGQDIGEFIFIKIKTSDWLTLKNNVGKFRRVLAKVNLD
jgi:hypothetical protein